MITAHKTPPAPHYLSTTLGLPGPTAHLDPQIPPDVPLRSHCSLRPTSGLQVLLLILLLLLILISDPTPSCHFHLSSFATPLQHQGTGACAQSLHIHPINHRFVSHHLLSIDHSFIGVDLVSKSCHRQRSACPYTHSPLLLVAEIPHCAPLPCTTVDDAILHFLLCCPRLTPLDDVSQPRCTIPLIPEISDPVAATKKRKKLVAPQIDWEDSQPSHRLFETTGILFASSQLPRTRAKKRNLSICLGTDVDKNSVKPQSPTFAKTRRTVIENYPKDSSLAFNWIHSIISEWMNAS